MRLLLPWLLLAATAALPQEPGQGQAKLANGSVSFLYTRVADEGKHPTLVILPGGAESVPSFRQWSTAAPAGWALVMPLVTSLNDAGAKAVEAVIETASAQVSIDRSRVYLAGAGGAAAEVFYTIARIPDMFAAGFAVEGNPSIAINTNRLYAANTQAAPLLWLNPPEGLDSVMAKLKQADFRLETANDLKSPQIFEWLFRHQRQTHPLKVDCETHSPAFSRCYWLEVVKFNLKRRNDVLPSSRVRPGTGASLDLGGFGYDPKAPGPGLLVAWLPENYEGPLRLNDRIVSVGGREIANSRDYLEFIDSVPEAKPTAVMIQRDSDRIRLETRFILPVREQTLTARMQAEYLPSQKEILLITRAVAALQVTVPPSWAPVRILWNGNAVEAKEAGCWLLTEADGEVSSGTCTTKESPAP